MAKTIGRNTNVYNSVEISTQVALTTATYTKLLEANPKRLRYKVENESVHKIKILEEAFDAQTVDDGELLPPSSVGESEPDQIPTGEIWAIAVTGTPTVKVTEV